MKCPYRNFEECIVQECPSCNYKIETYTDIQGKAPYYMDTESAIKQGYQWKVTKKKYVFESCRLVDNNVQPIPKSETHIHNKTTTNVAVNHSIF